MSVANVKGLLVGATFTGACRIEWQLQQRPDKSAKSDRFHKVGEAWFWGKDAAAVIGLNDRPSGSHRCTSHSASFHTAVACSLPEAFTYGGKDATG